jgi:hypothetical protein
MRSRRRYPRSSSSSRRIFTSIEAGWSSPKTKREGSKSEKLYSRAFDKPMLITFTQTSSSRVTCYPPPGPILWRRSYDGRSLPSFTSFTYRTFRCCTIMDSVVLQAPRALYHTAASIPPVGNKTRQGGSIFRSDTVEGFNTRPIRSSSSRRGTGAAHAERRPIGTKACPVIPAR